MAALAPDGLLTRIERGTAPRLVDVRSAAEFAAGHVPGAINIPYLEVPSRAGELRGPRDQEVVVYCGHGPRAWLAAAALRRLGFTRVIYLGGHWSGWQRARLPIEV
jgi:phage shock protein E